MDKKRIIGLDVGDRRVGIAVSDPLGLTAQPVETYTRVGYGPDTKHIRALADQYGTDQILCGLPRNMDGTEGFQVDKVREFAGKLQEAGLSVQYYDERMTTIQAESLLLEGGLHRDERKRKVDMVAAVMILQSYLDAEAQKKKAEQAAEKDADEAEEDEDIWTFEDEDGSPVKLHLVYELRYEGIEVTFRMASFFQMNGNEEYVDLKDLQLGQGQLLHLATLEFDEKTYMALGSVTPFENGAQISVMMVREQLDNEGVGHYEIVKDRKEISEIVPRLVEAFAPDAEFHLPEMDPGDFDEEDSSPFIFDCSGMDEYIS